MNFVSYEKILLGNAEANRMNTEFSIIEYKKKKKPL